MPWMDDAPVPGGESPRGLAGEARRGRVWSGSVWQARHGEAWRGMARRVGVSHGVLWQARQGTSWPGRRGGFWYVKARLGVAS